MLRAYVEGVVRYRFPVIGALICLTLFLGSRITVLKVNVDPDENLPQDHPYIQALNDLHRIFGEKNLLLIGLFPRDGQVFTPPFLGKIARITHEIGDLPGVVQSTLLSLASSRVKDIRGTEEGMVVTPVMDNTPHTPQEAEEVRRRLFANEAFIGTLVAFDGSAAAILADFDFTPELPGYAEIHAAVEKILQKELDETFDYHMAGPVVYVYYMARYSARMAIFFPIAVLVIGLIHYEAFRTLQGLLLPLVTALLSVAWGLGIMGMVHVSLDPFNTTTPILILAVAAGHAVQILKRYYEEYARLHDNRAAVIESTCKIGGVMIVAGVVASLAFFSLIVFRTAAIRNFGIFTGLGILSALTLEMTFIPALRASLPAPRRREVEREGRERRGLDPFLRGLVRFLSGKGRRAVLAGWCSVLALSLFFAHDIRIDTSFKRQFSSLHPLRQDDDILNRAFGGTSTLVFLVEGREDGSLEEPGVLRAIEALQKRMEKVEGVGKTISIVDFIKKMHMAMNGDGARFYRVPDSRNLVAQYLLLYAMSGGPDDFDAYIDPNHRVAAVRCFLRDDSTRYGEEVIAGVRTALPPLIPPGYRVQIAGTLASNAALTQVMVHGKILNILQISALIICIASAVLRSLTGGVLVAIPLALAVCVNFGIMGIFAIPLDVVTAAISAMAVGIGADYAIYFLFRFREEWQRGDTDSALQRTIMTSGKAIMYVSSAIAAGYLTLCLSGFAYHTRLGALVALAMIISSAGTLTVLPALLLTLKPRFLFGRSPGETTSMPVEETLSKKT